MAELRKAVFGMGCFWGPDALFGAQKGVVRTRVGYAGGEKDSPTYQSLGDHTETVMAEYDPEAISYKTLLEIFWGNHNYNRKRKPQYASKIFYLGEDQRYKAQDSMKKDSTTDLQPLEEFYVAEDYHQKYKLRHSELMNQFENLSSDEFRDSPLVAKANGYVAGYLDREKYRNLESNVQ